MKNLSLILIALLIGSYSHARRAPQGGCRLSYHADSAGRGIEAGFKGLNLLPSPGDQGCYDQGVEEGNTLPKGDQLCNNEFESGKRNGMLMTATTDGTDCYNKGYMAGQALLGVASRASDAQTVGQACVDQYQKGLSDGRQNAAPNQPESNPLTTCYFNGFYDASQLQYLKFLWKIHFGLLASKG